MFLLVVSVGIALVFFVQRTTTRIGEALAEEALQQTHDVANLLNEYANVMVAVERYQRIPNKETRSAVEFALHAAGSQLKKMRFQYSFERLDGAATAHAYVKPVLEDVGQWITKGVPGYSSAAPIALKMASQRLADRYDHLRLIASETQLVDTSIIAEQTDNLDRFRESLIYLLGLFALLALGIVALLVRQRNLQMRLRKDQENFAQRITDFADIGADWFWEMTAELKLNVLSGRALKADNQALDTEHESIFTAYNNQVADVHWPTDRLTARQEFAEFETDWVTPEGECRVISMSGKPLFAVDGKFAGYRGIGRDITKRIDIETELEAVYRELIQAQTLGRKQAEEALWDSEQFLSISLDAMASNIAILDTHGQIKVSNQAWRAYCGDGVTAGGVGGHYLEAFVARPAEELRCFDMASSKVAEVLSGKQASLHYEFQCQCESPDRLRWMVIHLTTFESNGLGYAVLVYEDITDRRNLENQDRKLRADFAHFSRLTTAGELATLLAHELNQPLTAISHNSDALLSSLKEREGPDSEVMEIVSDIYEQSQRAGGIIHSMRQMVRKDSPGVSNSSVDINQLVVDTVRLTHPEAREHNVDVRLQLSENLPGLLIDAVQIQQVLVNLERNGVEAIRSHDSELRQLYITTAQDDHDFIKVSVQDTGPGIGPDVERNLFRSFQTTKVDGMGMGLSISRSIVEAHGGRLWLDEPENGMTTFHFTLPVIKR